MSRVDSVLRKIMDQLNIQAPIEELKMGIEVEKEHTALGPNDGIYEVVPVKLIPLVKIAAAHLAEIPDYYTRLKAMEEEGKKVLAAKKNPKKPSKKESDKEETAIKPYDIVRKPKQPVTSAKETSQEITQLLKFRNNLNQIIHFLTNKLIPEAKNNPKKFNELKELKEYLELSRLSLQEIIQK